MHKRRRSRCAWICSSLLLLAIAVGLALFALRQNISLYLTPYELNMQHPDTTKILRLGGVVAKDSIHHWADSLRVDFSVTDYRSCVRVHYAGSLPALFRDGQGVIAEGRLDALGVFEASRVLAKHDARYYPRRVAEAK